MLLLKTSIAFVYSTHAWIFYSFLDPILISALEKRKQNSENQVNLGYNRSITSCWTNEQMNKRRRHGLLQLPRTNKHQPPIWHRKKPVIDQLQLYLQHPGLRVSFTFNSDCRVSTKHVLVWNNWYYLTKYQRHSCCHQPCYRDCDFSELLWQRRHRSTFFWWDGVRLCLCWEPKWNHQRNHYHWCWVRWCHE